jgi:hypothetical protein
MDDCDDDNADINPDATEICDEIDNDCDANIDDADDSLDTSTGSTFYADADGDGEGDADVSTMSCVLPDAHVENMTDCDDTDAALNNADVDSDGFSTCADADGFVDCDDTGATELTNSSLDGDCDGTLTADDCDDMDAMSTIMADDMDCDGLLPVENGGTDCDDMDVAVGATDVDGDGSLACVDDCDDNDATLYPGVAFNEADLTLCVEDADGDGYANYISDAPLTACFDIEMTDSYGDGWNGNEIEVYEDHMLTGTYANQDLDGSSFGVETQTEQHCIDSSASHVDFVFVDGSFTTEISFSISDASDGTVLGSATGSGTYDIIWEGTTFTDGDSFYTETQLTGGSDCDDADAATFGDDDGDGYTFCTVDCDDTDTTLNGDDLDGDGYSTCDDDCDDTPGTCDDPQFLNETDCTAGTCDDGVSLTEADCTTASGTWTAVGVWTAGGENFNPGMTETYYDGIDSDCDGWSDFDADMDGDEAMEYDDGTGTMITHTGYDCNDSSASYRTLSMEADSMACYYDADGDGYGDDTPSTTAEGYGVIAGTDCYDSYSGSTIGPTIYPGAAYMEDDVDGDGMTDCTQDSDGDGWGNATPSSWYYAAAGTDCDDSDEMLAPDLDADMDGVYACDDCDDMDAAAQGGMVYDDMDGDGQGDMDDMGMLVCDLTDLDTDADGVDDLSTNNMDCDDSDEFTYSGAGSMETAPLDEECLTDFDGDGYAAGIPAVMALYEGAVLMGDCYDITVTDSWGDGCNGSVDMYMDYMLDTSVDGPTAYTVTEQWCAPMDGMLQVGWTEASSYNSECGFSVADSSGTEMYASSGTISDVVPSEPSGGTDSDDADASVW